MKKTIIFAVLACVVPALAGVPGQQWILPIDRIDNQGSFTLFAGAGYSGQDVYSRGGTDGVARIWWNFNPADANTNVELYTVEAWGNAAGAGGTDWQPIQAVLNGYAGDTFPIEPGIPWAGQFSTNHQWLGGGVGTRDDWNQHGPGPQAPRDTDFNAPGDGINLWMKKGSVLFAKWDFPFAINRGYSAIRITQVTPEPASLMLLLLGAPLLRRKSR
jgi:hypothetical protein